MALLKALIATYENVFSNQKWTVGKSLADLQDYNSISYDS